MAHFKEWMPTRRGDKIAMARGWIKVLVNRGEEWGVTPQEIAGLSALTEKADAAWNLTQLPSSGKDTTALCRAAFAELGAFMRQLKKKRFLPPALSAVDFSDLSLKPRGTVKSREAAPVDIAAAWITHIGAQVLLVNIRRVSHNGVFPPAGYGVRISYGILHEGNPTAEEAAGHMRYIGSVPTSPEMLTHTRFTNRVKERFVFRSVDSGKRAYFCLRYLNSRREEGPWGPMSDAIIP